MFVNFCFRGPRRNNPEVFSPHDNNSQFVRNYGDAEGTVFGIDFLPLSRRGLRGCAVGFGDRLARPVFELCGDTGSSDDQRQTSGGYFPEQPSFSSQQPGDGPPTPPSH
jgi:hypothetical protein